MDISWLQRTRIGSRICSLIVDAFTRGTMRVHHGDVSLKLCIPNSLSRFRAVTFSTKEPETLTWIDSFPKGSIVWDIGANVGLYSCYAAAKGHRVIAFEPSPFNLEWLALNIHNNRLDVTVIPLPLTAHPGANTLNMSTTTWGGALSTFGESYGYDGQQLSVQFTYRTFGVTADFLSLPAPDFIKIDVDGIEHLVLKGIQSVLPTARGVLVELTQGTDMERQSSRILSEAGFSLDGHHRSEIVQGNQNTKNMIWSRPVFLNRNLTDDRSTELSSTA